MDGFDNSNNTWFADQSLTMLHQEASSNYAYLSPFTTWTLDLLGEVEDGELNPGLDVSNLDSFEVLLSGFYYA